MWFKSSLTPLAVAAISFCLIDGTTPAYADHGDQLAKLLPDDGDGGDRFGYRVAISGTTAIIGAFNDDDNSASGSAYLFNITTGDQLSKLLPSNGPGADRFGISVAISGATVIVGAVRDDANGEDSGSAYIFDISDPENPVQIAKFLPDDGAADDQFGWSAAISGTTALVGAHFDADNGTDSGSVYLFDISDPANPTQVAKLLPRDGAAGDRFGGSVAIGGTTVIISAHGDDDNGTNSGSAYIFDISDPANPTQIAKLLPDDGAESDVFGFSVAISGATAIVGAVLDDDNDNGSGSAYLFDISDPANPTQIVKLLPNDGASGDLFGASVAISGTTLIVGAYADDANGEDSGSAYLFNISVPANPTQIAKLLPDDGAADDFFGWVVAISGTPGEEVAIVGAYADADNGTNSGSAYLFDAAGATPCPWDLDGSGSVGASDLLALLVSWGPCKGCPADFDGDGNVGKSDLLALLVNWGPCP